MGHISTSVCLKTTHNTFRSCFYIITQSFSKQLLTQNTWVAWVIKNICTLWLIKDSVTIDNPVINLPEAIFTRNQLLKISPWVSRMKWRNKFRRYGCFHNQCPNNYTITVFHPSLMKILKIDLSPTLCLRDWLLVYINFLFSEQLLKSNRWSLKCHFTLQRRKNFVSLNVFVRCSKHVKTIHDIKKIVYLIHWFHNVCLNSVLKLTIDLFQKHWLYNGYKFFRVHWINVFFFVLKAYIAMWPFKYQGSEMHDFTMRDFQIRMVNDKHCQKRLKLST